MKKKNKLGEKIGSITSSISGAMGFFGGYQVCHNLCMGIIALLSLIGITVVGMPLLFLQKVAVPFWIAAVLLFGITLFFYFQKKCISKNLIIFNAGIIIAGVPFSQLQNFTWIFWLIGGAIVLFSLILYARQKFRQRKTF